MKVILDRIVLYSYDGRQRPLKFRHDGLNIITGDSKTGKSAIIHVVDYCLGSAECHVPGGIIRRKVNWYSIVLQSEKQRLFIARKNPESGRASSTQIYVAMGAQVEIPSMDDLIQNVDVDGLKSILNRFIGIEENLHIPAEDQTRDPLSANISHSRIFCFQDQGLIDNKNQLFFNQSDSFVELAIKDTLPYFLGAVTGSELLKQRELQKLKREHKVLERKIFDSADWAELNSNKIAALVTEARQVGLISIDVRPTTKEANLALLNSIKATRILTNESSFTDSAELKELHVERDQFRALFFETKERLDELSAFGSHRDAYDVELGEQAARLGAIRLMEHSDTSACICPLCDQLVPEMTIKIGELHEDLEGLTNRISNLRASNPRLQGQIVEVTRQLEDIGNRISANQSQINSAEQQFEQIKIEKESAIRKSRVQGRISSLLETVDDEELEENRKSLRLLAARIKELESQISGDNYEDRLRHIEFVLAEYMTDYARKLDLEHSEGRTRLDFKRLTVVSETKYGSLKLENMGSGDNWVGCHVLTHAALHRWFRDNSRPVPAFLILDQPSKAHYPPNAEQMVAGVVTDDDRKAVKRLFKFIHDQSFEGKYQALVIDHADEPENWFQNCVVEKWRGGTKLVPDNWPDSTA